MRIVSKLAASLVVSLIVLTVVSGPAMANATVMTVYHTDTTFAIDDWCDFNVQFHIVGSYKGIDYYDNAGFLYKTIFTAGGGSPSTWTASGNGKKLTMQMQSFMQVNTYNSDGSIRTLTIHGVDLKFTARGQGLVLQDIGTVVRDEDFEVLSVSGPHDSLVGDFDAFCDALS